MSAEDDELHSAIALNLWIALLRQGYNGVSMSIGVGEHRVRLSPEWTSLRSLRPAARQQV